MPDERADLTATTSDGVTITFLDLGGTGPPILFAHATGFCATVWRPLARRLGALGTCWALDARGHGRSGRPESGSFHWDGTASDLLAVVDAVDSTALDQTDTDQANTDRALTRRRWRGVGHSMGGAALLLAEQRRPGTFERLWLYEPIVFPPDPVFHQGGSDLAEGAARRRATFASRRAAHDNYSSKPPMGSFDRLALDGYLERGLVDLDDGSGGVRLACRPADESEMYRMGGTHTAWDGLSGVRCPTTVVRGSTAFGGPAAVAADIARRLPDGLLDDRPHLGHFGPMEAPEELADSITTAFERFANPGHADPPSGVPGS